VRNIGVCYSKESRLIDDSLFQNSCFLNVPLRTSVNFVQHACISVRCAVHITINVRSFILSCRCTLYGHKIFHINLVHLSKLSK